MTLETSICHSVEQEMNQTTQDCMSFLCHEGHPGFRYEQSFRLSSLVLVRFFARCLNERYRADFPCSPPCKEVDMFDMATDNLKEKHFFVLLPYHLESESPTVKVLKTHLLHSCFSKTTLFSVLSSERRKTPNSCAIWMNILETIGTLVYRWRWLEYKAEFSLLAFVERKLWNVHSQRVFLWPRKNFARSEGRPEGDAVARWPHSELLVSEKPKVESGPGAMRKILQSG